MTNGKRIITIPRANPVNAFTMDGIVVNAGLTIEGFKELLEELIKAFSLFVLNCNITIVNRTMGLLNEGASILSPREYTNRYLPHAPTS
jgi:hypothetical protein